MQVGASRPVREAQYRVRGEFHRRPTTWWKGVVKSASAGGGEVVVETKVGMLGGSAITSRLATGAPWRWARERDSSGQKPSRRTTSTTYPARSASPATWEHFALRDETAAGIVLKADIGNRWPELSWGSDVLRVHPIRW